MSESLNTDQSFIRKLTAIIQANLGNENFGAKELAHESGMSLYRLNRRLHSINGKTSSRFIREVRLQKAHELLQNEAYTVSEVAFKTGFSSPSYFISCFHEYFGHPPGKVAKLDSDNHKQIPHVASAPGKNRQVSSSFLFVSSGVLILAVLFYLAYNLFSGNFSAEKNTPAVDTRKSIAVLPFRNLSKNPDDQYIYDGVMEEIFNSLAKMHELRVISRTSVEQYRNTDKTIPVIGQELDVDYIIEGSGQKIGNTFRIRVQLIEVATDMHIWSKPFQHKMKETKKLFRIQSRIAQNIASELKLTITPDEKALIEKVPSSNSSAYNLYLKANDYRKDYEKTRNRSSYQTTVDLYNAAIAIDSAFAKAYTGLAFAFWNRYYYETYFEENYLDSCRVLAEKALSFDSLLDEAYYLKGQYYRVNGQGEEALGNYDKALKINPNYFAAYERKGYLLNWVLGDYVKGLNNNHKALNLIRGKERSESLKDLGRDYLDVGFIDKAKYYYHEAFVLDSNKASWLGNIAFVEFCQGNFEQAFNYKKQQKEIDSTATNLLFYSVIPGHNKERYFDAKTYVEERVKLGALTLQSSHRIGYAFWQVGKKKESEYYFNQQIRYSEESIKLNRDIDQRKAAQYDLAGTYAFLGDKVKAYKYLDEVAQKNTFPMWMVTFAKHDLLFENIRKEERFQKVLQIIESKYQAEHERVRKWLEVQGNL